MQIADFRSLVYYNSLKSWPVARNPFRAATVRKRDTSRGDFGCGQAALWGSLLSCGRLSIGLRRLPTAAQDTILPHYDLNSLCK